MTANRHELPGWMIAWLNCEANKVVERENPFLWKNILLAGQQMSGLQVLFHDLYKTVAGVRHSACCANATEPTEDVRHLLGLGADRRYDVKNACLTTAHLNARQYLEEVKDRLQLATAVTDQMVDDLQHRIDIEQQLLYIFHEVHLVLKRLKSAYRQGLITDSWPFPIDRMLHASGLKEVLEEPLVIVSSLKQICKGTADGTGLYREAALAAGFSQVPFRMLGMVGDNLFRDIFPALKLGFVAILLDRDYEYMDRFGGWRTLVRPEKLLMEDGMDKLGRLGQTRLRELFDDCCDLLVPCGEYLPGRAVCLTDEGGGMRTAVIGNLTLKQAWDLKVSYADLLVDTYDHRQRPWQARLGDLQLPVLRSYDHIPAPLLTEQDG